MAIEKSSVKSQFMGFQEGLQKIEAYSNSKAFLELSSRYGKKADGENRIQIMDFPLIHRSKNAGKIKLEGFDTTKRNPYILGFCFIPEWDEDRWELKERGESVRVFLLGACWNPCGNQEVQLDVLTGRTSDPKWNELVRNVAKEVGLELPWRPWPEEEEFWAARGRFAESIRQRLLNEGIVGVCVGGELDVINAQAIYIIKGECL